MGKKEQDEAIVELFARIKAGVTINPEDADRFAAAAGVDAEEVASRAAVLDPTFEWEDAQTRQSRVRVVVPEHQYAGEAEAANVLDGGTSVVASPPHATGSNDPAVNPGATGKEPFEDTPSNSSGQVIDAGEYKPEDDDNKGKK